jgi:hypothetical protein
VFLFSVILLSLLSLSLSEIMINVQAYSGSTSGNNGSGNETRVTQMGICVVGVGGPCNDGSDFDGIDHNPR